MPTPPGAPLILEPQKIADDIETDWNGEGMKDCDRGQLGEVYHCYEKADLPFPAGLLSLNDADGLAVDLHYNSPDYLENAYA